MSKKYFAPLIVGLLPLYGLSYESPASEDVLCAGCNGAGIPPQTQEEPLPSHLVKEHSEAELTLDETFMEMMLYDFFASHEVTLNDEKVPLLAMPMVAFDEFRECTAFDNMMNQHEKVVYAGDTYYRMQTVTGVDLAIKIMATDQKPNDCNISAAWVPENLLHSDDYDYPYGNDPGDGSLKPHIGLNETDSTESSLVSAFIAMNDYGDGDPIDYIDDLNDPESYSLEVGPVVVFEAETCHKLINNLIRDSVKVDWVTGSKFFVMETNKYDGWDDNEELVHITLWTVTETEKNCQAVGAWVPSIVIYGDEYDL